MRSDARNFLRIIIIGGCTQLGVRRGETLIRRMTPVPTRRVASRPSRFPASAQGTAETLGPPSHGLTTRHRTQGLSLWSLNIVGGEISDLPRHSLTLRSLLRGFSYGLLVVRLGTTAFGCRGDPPAGRARCPLCLTAFVPALSHIPVPAVPHCIRPCAPY